MFMNIAIVPPGDCIDGECVCNEGSYGEDCSITGEVAPTVLEPICCDTSKGPCTQMTLYGAGFLSGHRISCLISPLLVRIAHKHINTILHITITCNM